MLIFGLFVALIGITAFLAIGPTAKTAVMSGGTVGLISIGWSVLIRQGKPWAVTGAMVTLVFLLGVFAWRASVGWMAYANGNTAKAVPAALISAMWVAAAASLALLAAARRSGGVISHRAAGS
jgi:hypothetical protein